MMFWLHLFKKGGKRWINTSVVAKLPMTLMLVSNLYYKLIPSSWVPNIHQTVLFVKQSWCH